MKIGFETIAWGPRFKSLESVLDTIAAAGYQGVEFSQRPETLGDIGTLLDLLKERDLVLLGLIGGSLSERVRFCEGYKNAYLTIYDWSPQASRATKQDFQLALHPHMYRARHRWPAALELLTQHPALKFLPDTAILTISGDDAQLAVRKALEIGSERLAGIHLKDWSPVFGRSIHRYARGFTDLGNGKVPIKAVLAELEEWKYEGWVVVEHDSPRAGARKCAFGCAAWLVNEGLLPPLNAAAVEAEFLNEDLDRDLEIVEKVDNCAVDALHKLALLEKRFLQTMALAANEDLIDCYQSIVRAFNELVPSHFVSLWLFNPARDLMSLLAAEPPAIASEIESTVEFSSALSAISIERQITTRFDLLQEEPGRPFGYPSRRFSTPELIGKFGLSQMVSVPILSDSNPHHPRLLINLCPTEEKTPVTDKVLSRLCTYVAIAADAALDEECSFAAARASIVAAESNIGIAGATIRAAEESEVHDYLQQIRELVESRLRCESVTIFLVNDAGDRLELIESTSEIHWNCPRQEEYYSKGEGVTGGVWETKEAVLSIDPSREPNHLGKSQEQSYRKRQSYLCAPIVDHAGEVVGVVRCSNKRPDQRGGFTMFTNDDVAVLDAIGQTAAPHLQLLRTNVRRAKAFNRLTHELRHPLGPIRTAAGRMRSSLKYREIPAESLFDHDYIGNILSYTDLMSVLIDNTDFLRKTPSQIPLFFQQTKLMGDVIAPAVQQIKGLLIDPEFSVKNIRYGTFRAIPALWIDKNRFQQVIFNLLSNSVKYAYKDPELFDVEIFGRQSSGSYQIIFRDEGMGIGPGIEQLIFEEGFRTLEAKRLNLSGEGLGLWIVRQIVEAHGGRIELTSSRQPTEFVISLPLSLSSRQPARVTLG